LFGFVDIRTPLSDGIAQTGHLTPKVFPARRVGSGQRTLILCSGRP
jgi:hypothetical protein